MLTSARRRSMHRCGPDFGFRRGFVRIAVTLILAQAMIILYSTKIPSNADRNTIEKEKSSVIFPRATDIDVFKSIKSNYFTPVVPRPEVLQDSEDHGRVVRWEKATLNESHLSTSGRHPSKETPETQQNANNRETKDMEPKTLKRKETSPFVLSHPGEQILRDDKRTYFYPIKDHKVCYVFGTDPSSVHKDATECICNKDYFGEDCGIPSAAWLGFFGKERKMAKALSRRKIPRRVINIFPVNHEFVMFEARLHELYDTVDVFVIGESNYTAHGDPKTLEFFERLNEGYMKEFQNKMMYVFLGFFPEEGKTNGWIADHYIRYYMGLKSLPNIQGLRDDDLIVLSDADEIPTKEIVKFLKLYDGYPEPVGFGLQWNVFGFFWKKAPDMSVWNWLSGAKEKLTVVYSAATIGMLREVLRNNTFFIRKEDVWKHHTLKEGLKAYRSKGHVVANWVAGIPRHYAGWHCSWCFDPDGLVRKMEAAQVNDTPRWGDIPQMKNRAHLRTLIVRGRWFDNSPDLVPTNVRDPMYAPPYLMQNPGLYRSILFHPETSSQLPASKTFQLPRN